MKIRELGVNTKKEIEREPNDFYATSPEPIKKLLEREDFSKTVWECAYGLGHISKILEENNYLVRKSDIIKRDKTQIEIIDFTKYNGKWSGDIITNPPYKSATEFVLKALDIINKGNKVAMLLKIQFLESINRYEKIFKKNNPKIVYSFSKRIHIARGGNFEKYKSNVLFFAWFIWEKGYVGNTILEWI